MLEVQEILEKHSLTICSVFQDTNLATVYLVINNEGKKAVLKLYHDPLKSGRSIALERNFLTRVNHEKLKYLDIPRLLDHGKNYMIMEYVEREHWTRSTILEREWSNEDIKTWVRGLIEFQNTQLSKDWFSFKRRAIGFMFPIIRLALLLPRCFHIIYKMDLLKIIRLSWRRW